MAAALEVSGVRKSYGAVCALAGVDLVVPPGTITAVLGPSGCGKTTLLRVVAGFEVPDSGAVDISGRQVAGGGRFVPPERRGVGVVPQEGALFPHLTVGANIGFGLPRAERAERVEEMLELVGLTGYARRMPDELSGGEQQRVALARALAGKPELVLLDEPFSALDAALRAALREHVRETLRRANTTGVIVTHDQQEALSIAELVAVMRAGRVVQVADPVTLYEQPADLGVARFVGESVVLPAVIDGPVAECALGRLALRKELGKAAGHVMLRPEQVLVGEPAEGASAEVLAVTYFGHDALIRLRLGDDAVELTARVHGPRVPRVGARVGVRVAGDVAAYPEPA